ncbi:cysteine desulfurase family protein [Chitinophaga barathri]|uniref:cysteine desulfurase n=1 Tax=Chitinophaga barathri TaxID=1647451 RepID=A0A3N4MXB2_9BACT|nr:IscS subfamily cysteine desulfurase [Chitinophaga barathri]RPD40043.1 aminotransferase class V-fold PLP-dependent enzyme [Chitinophaga barathri]
MQQPPVYLDYNATTPCDPRVVETMLPFFTRHFGNAASRNHAYGWAAEEAVDHARQQVATLIGAETQEVIFTSGATEAVNLGIKGLFEAYAGKGNHIITAETEHKAVLDTVSHLEKQGASVTRLKVNAAGLVDPAELEAAITEQTVLVAIMYANNETGVIQPMAEISRIARERDVILFTDGTQAVGKIPLNVRQEGIGMMAFSAHKLYGPKGVGALYVRRRGPRVKIIAQMDGGGHERGMRSGTLNVPGIAGFGKACELAGAEMAAATGRLSAMRDRLETTILAREHATVNGLGAPRLPHVTNIAFYGIQGDALLRAISRQIAVSSGSACTSANPEPSHVLRAMGLEEELAHSSLRFAVGRFTTDAEIDFAISAVENTIREFNEILK